MSRRRFFQTAAGHGDRVSRDERHLRADLRRVARRGGRAGARQRAREAALAGQFIMDMHTHFLRPGTRIMTFVNQRNAVGKAGWNPALAGKEQTIDDLMFTNYLKEIYLDSDTKVALHQRRAFGGAGGLVPHQRDEGAGARRRQRPRAAPSACSRTRSSRPATTAGWSRSITRIDDAQARFDEGLHDRRQHQQEPVQAPVADGRREARLSRATRSSSRPG